MISKCGTCLQQNSNSNRLLVRLWGADNLEIRDTLDIDVDRLVLTTDVGPFAVCIALVADASGLPATTAPLAIVAPLARHVEPVVISSYWVRPLRDEGLEFVCAFFLDEDALASVRLEDTTIWNK